MPLTLPLWLLLLVALCPVGFVCVAELALALQLHLLLNLQQPVLLQALLVQFFVAVALEVEVV